MTLKVFVLLLGRITIVKIVMAEVIFTIPVESTVLLLGTVILIVSDFYKIFRSIN